MNSTKIFIQLLLMSIPFSYVIAGFKNQGVDPYKGLVADEEQLAKHEAHKLKLMNKHWYGKDSVKSKKPNKEETDCLSFLRSLLNIKKKKNDDKEFTTNLLNNNKYWQTFSDPHKSLNAGNDFSFSNTKANSEPETPKFPVKGNNPFYDISN
ncbi:unnamed protein product [Meloidogyne enterolobii]|uniref:Uncharacterized protein n=1 Tax=Meloidogyne enterolobii TaxID=390850 RepID=A0ACB1AXV6_MELEN